MMRITTRGFRAQKTDDRGQMSLLSSLIRVDARGQRRRLYETTPKWHCFSSMKPAALAAGRNSEPQNIEYRTAECRRMESLCSVFFFKIDRIHYFDIRHSLFDIRYSLFHSFFSIKLAAFQASGTACRTHLKTEISFFDQNNLR